MNRSDVGYAHRFLLCHRKLCVALALVFMLIGFAFAGDWVGHSDANPNWQVKQWFGAALAWFAAIMMAGYAAAGGKK